MHTPGPWIASNVNSPDEDIATAVWQNDGTADYWQRTSQICECHYSEEGDDAFEQQDARPISIPEARANARLIAAAPIMRAALEKIRDVRDHHADLGVYPEGTVNEDQAFDDWAADIAGAAIAHAIGQG